MFHIDQSPLNGKYMVLPNEDLIYQFSNFHSFAAIASRVLGLSYPEYLRFVRERYNGELYGKKGYPIVYFSNKEDAKKLCALLNEYWHKGMKNS